MSDLISRQSAIDVLKKILPADPMRNDYTEGITCGAALAMEYIKQLPSAEPEIIHCGECAFAEVLDIVDVQDGYVCQFHPGSIWFSGSFCSWAKVKMEVTE